MGGKFTVVNGTNRNYLARLGTNGLLDLTFNPNVNAPARCLAVQPDGRILVGGEFTSVGGTARDRLVRLEASGAVDGSFVPSANGPISCAALQVDGKILQRQFIIKTGGL